VSTIDKEGTLRNVEEEVRTFIAGNFLLTAEMVDLAGGESLTQLGVIDSVGVLELMLFLETNYLIEIPDHEVVPDNMDTVDNIVRYIERKLETAGKGASDHDYADYLV
jgi:acyl carrier protein